VDQWLRVVLFSFMPATALLLGGWCGARRIGRGVRAFSLAFASGIFISVISFTLVPQAYRFTGLAPASAAFVAGALSFLALNEAVSKRVSPGYGLAIGTVMDDLPEALALGAGLVSGGGLGAVMAVSIFLHNLPEGLVSANDLVTEGGKDVREVGRTMIGLAMVNPAAAVAGYVLLRGVGRAWLGALMAFAAGAILYMVADEMIPKARSEGGRAEVFGIVFGFLASYVVAVMVGG